MADTADKLLADMAWDFYTYAYAYDGGGNLIYIGRAPISSSKASSVWQIINLVYDGSGQLTDKLWANKGSFNNVWNDRASLTYT